MANELDTLKLAAARLWATERSPYFAAGLFAMFPVASPGIGTIAVDGGWRMYVDPDVMDSCGVPELGSILVHLLGHLLRDHAGRATDAAVTEERAREWTLAADAEINDDLPTGGYRVPKGQARPEDFGWRPHELAESYFLLLERKAAGPARADGDDGPGTSEAGQAGGRSRKSKGESASETARVEPGDCGSGAHGLTRSWDEAGQEAPGLGRLEVELLRHRVAEAVAEHARSAGTIPAGWRRWAQGELSPTVDWRRVLAHEIRRGLRRAAGRADYTFARRSRRASAARHVVLPGTFRPAPQLAVVVDTSGSMGTDELREALAEVEGIIQRSGLASRRVPVLACDAEVGAISHATRASEVVFTGGGGTDMGVGISAAARLQPRPQLVVVLTDGATPWPTSPPPGLAVVVGLIGEDRRHAAVPRWARAVVVGSGVR